METSNRGCHSPLPHQKERKQAKKKKRQKNTCILDHELSVSPYFCFQVKLWSEAVTCSNIMEKKRMWQKGTFRYPESYQKEKKACRVAV